MVVRPSAFAAGPPNAAATPGRWMGVGVSGAADAGPAAAAADAAGQALAGRDAALLVVSGDAGQDPAELAAGVGAVAPGTPMIGGNVGGELCRGGSSTGRVLVVAFGGEGFTVATGCGQASAAGPAEAAEQAAGCLARLEDRPHQVLLMLSDATIGDQQEVLRGAYRTAGAGVPLVGGGCPIPAGAGSGWQLHDGRVVRGTVVAAALGSTDPFGIGVGHGWQPVGEPMLVTASSGNEVHELDDQPALARYLQHLPGRRLGSSRSAAGDVGMGEFAAAAFVRAAALHPLGLRRRHGALIRSVVRAEPGSGSLVCAAEVPQGALVWLMQGSVASVLAGMDQACEQALAAVGAVGSAGTVGLLAFDCIARQRILVTEQHSRVGDGGSAGGGPGTGGVQQEAARFAVHAGGAPFAGVYTAGEIARVQGLSGFHNKTVAVLAVG